MEKELRQLWVGLDVDSVPKLFWVVEGKPVLLTHADWLLIHKHFAAAAGEMLKVRLAREGFEDGFPGWEGWQGEFG